MISGSSGPLAEGFYDIWQLGPLIAILTSKNLQKIHPAIFGFFLNLGYWLVS